MRILLLRVHSIRNAGDHAILRATQHLVSKAFPGSRLTVALQDPAQAQALYGDEDYLGGLLSWIVERDSSGRQRIKRLHWLWYTVLVLLSVLLYRVAGRRWIPFADSEKRRLIEAYFDADLVLSSGGGYIYNSRGHSGWFIGLILELAVPIWLGKPLILLPQSIGPFSGGEQRLLVRWLLRRSRLVLLREERSARFLAGIKAGGPLLMFPDLAFSQVSAAEESGRQWLEQQGVDRSGKYWLAGMTALNWAGQFSTFKRQQEYEDALVDCCNALIARGAQVLFLPQSCGPTAAEDDRIVAQRVRERLQQPERCVVAWDQPLPEVLQAASSEFKLFVGTRMHSSIFALNACVPTVTIGYLHKSRGMLEWLGWDRWLIDIDEIESEKLLALVDALCAESDALLPELRRRVGRIRRLSAALPGLLAATWAAYCREAG